jgi:hypothetical protein
VNTPLPTPLVLPVGGTYVILIHENGAQYFWSQSLPATFPDGTINQSWWDFGDQFPTQSGGAQWYFVDLLYATDFAPAPVNPTATANFSSGAWSGNIAALQAGTNMILQANADVAHSGASSPFTVLNTPKLAIATSSNSIVLSWPTAASGFSLEQGSTLSNWSAAPVTNFVIGDHYIVTNTIGTDPAFFRLRKP